MGKVINNHLRNGYSDYNLLFIKKYVNEIKVTDKILDVGCGHLRNLYLFHLLGFKNLYGIDKHLPDPSKKDSDEPFLVNFVNQDILEGLPYTSKGFEIVVCNFVLMFIPSSSLEFVLSEILRVTSKFCIIETQKQHYKAKNSHMAAYDFETIVKYILNNGDFEILDKKQSKEKLILRRKAYGKN